MSTSTFVSPTKRSRSPSAEVSPPPQPKSQHTPAKLDPTLKTSPMPPVGMFSTKSPAPVSRRSTPTSSPVRLRSHAHIRLKSSHQARPAVVRPDTVAEARREKSKASTVGPGKPYAGQPLQVAFEESFSVPASSSNPAATSATTVWPANIVIQPSARLATAASTVFSLRSTPTVYDEQYRDNGNNQAQDATTKLSIAILLETLRGADNGSSIIDSITAALSSLAQLTSTYQLVLAAPISSTDCDLIIHALREFKHGINAKSATEEAPLPMSSAKRSSSSNGDTTANPQLNQEALPHIKEAHDHGFKAGVSAARKTFLAEMNTRVQEAHDRGFKAGVTAAKKSSRTNQEAVTRLDMEGSKQLEQCKEWLCGIVRARDMGEKAQIGAIISKAEMAEWLEHEPYDGSEDRIMVG